MAARPAFNPVAPAPARTPAFHELRFTSPGGKASPARSAPPVAIYRNCGDNGRPTFTGGLMRRPLIRTTLLAATFATAFGGCQDSSNDRPAATGPAARADARADAQPAAPQGA